MGYQDSCFDVGGFHNCRSGVARVKMIPNRTMTKMRAAFRQAPYSRRRMLSAVFLSAFAVLAPARGVIFYSTADPSYNTTAPTGTLAGSGWQWVGNFGGYAGTPIGQHYFLAAHHIGGTDGQIFTFNGIGYTTTAHFDDTVSDLRIWQVSGSFPTWASLYRGSGEVGSPLVVFGMGLSRGSEIDVNGSIAGWMWGSGGGTLRWGTNTVYEVVNGGSYWGALLYALFQSGMGPNEAHLANEDSSGPVFINDGSGWKLAGVAAAVDGPFNTTDMGSGFEAALFDARGLYWDDNGTWELVTGMAPVPSGFYATQVSVRASWIDSIVPPDTGSSDSPLFSGPQAIALLCIIAVVGMGHLWRADMGARHS